MQKMHVVDVRGSQTIEPLAECLTRGSHCWDSWPSCRRGEGGPGKAESLQACTAGGQRGRVPAQQSG